MGFKLKPVEEKFFAYLEDHADLIKDAVDILVDAVNKPEDLANSLDKIDKLEQDADEIVTVITTKLQKTFITPFDREDIFSLAQKQDDIVDCVKGIVERMHLYNMGPASARTIELTELLLKMAKHIQKAIGHLDNIKKSYQKIEEHCKKIKELEAEGDRIYREEMARLFRECTNPVEIIKLKDIFNIFEETMDVAEDVADLIKKVVLKYA